MLSLTSGLFRSVSWSVAILSTRQRGGRALKISNSIPIPSPIFRYIKLQGIFVSRHFVFCPVPCLADELRDSFPVIAHLESFVKIRRGL